MTAFGELSSTTTPDRAAARSEARDIEVSDVCKSYGGANAVDGVDFSLQHGEFLTLLGPSGSGKTTTLLMVAGFEQPTSGDIRVAGRSVIHDPPQRRNLGVVFQSYALFPHMSVVENVEFPLTMRGVARRDRRDRAVDILDKVGLAGFDQRRPRQLSGGQQQRVALARALVFEPDALLLDEPLGALDKRLRELMQTEIKALHSRMGISVLYVTHDQDEAMTMSDRIAVMCDGKIVQLGAPADLYHHPVSPFVAQFLGDTNLLACTRQASSEQGRAQVRYTDGSCGLAREVRDHPPAAGAFQVSVRPERVDVLQAGETRENQLEATVCDRAFLGSHARYVLHALGQELMIKRVEGERGPALQPGTAVTVGWSADDAQLLAVNDGQ